MALLIGIVFLGVGVFFIWQSRQMRAKASAAAGWPSAPGRIVESRVIESESWNSETNRNERTRLARIVYDYQVGNQTYRADRFGLGKSVGAPQVAVQQHPVGRPVQVHFNPQNPNDAALYVSKSQSYMMVIFGGLFLFFGSLAILVALIGMLMRRA